MKPYLFLDMDGVLNGDSRRFSEVHVVSVPAEKIPQSLFTIKAEPGTVLEFTIKFEPRHKEWLKELSEHFELVWATTWENAANEYLSDFLGLGQLPVVEFSKKPAKFGMRNDVAFWKYQSLLEFTDGRPWAFVDDQAWTLKRMRDLGDGVPALVVVPRYGLTRQDVDTLLAFAANPESALEDDDEGDD
jgi:hypothetical protein